MDFGLWLSKYGMLSLAVLSLIAGQIYAYAVLRITVKQIEQQAERITKRLELIEEEFENHQRSAALHRTADFEARFNSLEGTLQRIERKLDSQLNRNER